MRNRPQRSWVESGPDRAILPAGQYVKASAVPVLALTADIPADVSTPGMIVPGGIVSSVFETADDVDWFEVTLQAGQTISVFTSTPRDAVTVAWPTIQFHDTAGELIAGPLAVRDYFSQRIVTSFTAQESGTYYVSASAWGAAGAAYSLAAAVRPDDYAGDPGTAGVVNSAGPTTGVIESQGAWSTYTVQDLDWFAVDLSAGQSLDLMFGTEAAWDSIRVWIRDATGAILPAAQGSSGGRDTLFYTAFTPGTVYVAIEGYSSAADATYTFDARIFSDDYRSSWSDPAVVPFGTLSLNSGTSHGVLEHSDDRDFFRIEMSPGAGYAFTLSAEQDGPGSLYGYLVDGNGSRIVSTQARSDDGTSTRLTWSTQQGGTYYLEVLSASGATGSYALSVATIPDDNPVGRPTHLDGPSLSGTFDFQNDLDAFTFNGTAGQIVLLDFIFSGLANIKLRSPSGQIVEAALRSWIGQQTSVFRLPESGTYTLELGGGVDAGPLPYSVGLTAWSDYVAPAPFAFLFDDSSILWHPLPTPALTPHGDPIPSAIYLGAPTWDGLPGPSSYTVSSGEALWATGYTGIVFGGVRDASLVNNGLIWAQGGFVPGGIMSAVALGGMNWLDVVNNGAIISVSRDGAGAYGFLTGSSGILQNNGDLIVIATGRPTLAIGYETFASEGAPGDGHAASIPVNTGRIFVFSESFRATGVSLVNSISFDNSGEICVVGFSDATAISMTYGRVRNSGTITAYNLELPLETGTRLSTGISAGLLILENTGSIEADQAILTFGVLTIDNRTSGQILGDIVQYNSSNVQGSIVTNAGLIVGDVWLDAGDDVLDTFLGTLIGRAFLGFGNDHATGGSGADTFFGETGNDELRGNGGDDLLHGGSGNDLLDGGSGSDTASYHGAQSGVTASLVSGVLSGGAGNDTLVSIENLIGSGYWDSLTGSDGTANRLAGGDGDDTIAGLSGDDILWGDAGNDALDGGPGHDTLFGGAGSDTAVYASATGGVTVRLWNGTSAGGAGNDTLNSIENIIGSAHSDSLLGSDGVANRIEGGAGQDYINGFSGDDVLLGGLGNDTLLGGDGADLLDGGLGNDSIDGGAGVDTATFTGLARSVTVRLFAGTSTGGAGNDTLTNIENLIGTAFADSLLGADGVNNRLEGGDGGDYLNGYGGNDTLIGGAGNDLLEGMLGNDVLDGGEGVDTAYYANSAAAVIVRLWNGTSAGAAGTDTFISIENIVGSRFSDSLIGADGANNRLDGGDGQDYLYGFTGDDVLIGGNGNDQLTGGDGIDLLDGGLGNDALDGGAGIDTATYVSATAAVTVRLFNGTATGGAGNDTLTGVENLVGSNFSDSLLGADGVANLIEGGSGSDYLNGFSGNDTLAGGDGADTLVGGLGNDYLDGGTGADSYVFDAALGAANIDRIAGFSVVDDTIRIDDAVFTGGGLSLGVLDASAFVVGAAATTAAHRIVYNSGTGQLFYDADGSGAGAAILFATLDSGLGLTSADFLVI